MTPRYLIDFDVVPPIGTVVLAGRRNATRRCKLVRIEPHVRKRDWAKSFVLHWIDQFGTHYTSGIQSKSLTKRALGSEDDDI